MHTMRWPVLAMVLVVGSGGVSYCAAAQAETTGAPGAKRRPNFLVILCDDLGYGDLGCYGHPVIRTPHLDRLASQGMRLTDGYAAAPVCSPARAGLLTGRNPNRMGVYDWIPAGHAMHLPADEVTVATLLRRGGYDTCHVGKWHCNGQFNAPAQPQPGDHGFNHWFSTQNNAHPSHHNPDNFVRNGSPAGPLEGYACQIVADEAVDWLEAKRDPEKPFFLYVCFHEPHEPIASPPAMVDSYRQAGITEEGRALYYANVTNMDAAVGRLMAALDRLDLADDTLVWFTSDNGPETLDRYPAAWRSFGSPGPLRGMKLHLYEGGIRVPGILRWPGRTRAGQVCHKAVSGVDVLPTLCELAGVNVPDDRPMDGASIVPVFSGRPVARNTPLFWFYGQALGGPKVALREGPFKLLGRWNLPEATGRSSAHADNTRRMKGARLTEFALYDLGDDLAERDDRAGRDPTRVEAMSKRASEMLSQIQAECPVWEEPTASRPAAR